MTMEPRDPVLEALAGVEAAVAAARAARVAELAAIDPGFGVRVPVFAEDIRPGHVIAERPGDLWRVEASGRLVSDDVFGPDAFEFECTSVTDPAARKTVVEFEAKKLWVTSESFGEVGGFDGWDDEDLRPFVDGLRQLAESEAGAS